jgi:antitoxin VapB
MIEERAVPLYIRSEQVDRLARELAATTGEGITEAVGKALAERLERIKPRALSRSERERRERAMEHLWRARELCLAQRVKAPTKREVEEMLGMDL